jgi:arylsulfatase A-like enzyme
MATPATATPARPDIIVFMTDDMRAGDWRVLNETERLIGGTWFPNFVYSTPLCCPTRATFFSGLYAHNHGVKRNRGGWDTFQKLEYDTLATALDGVGYHTAFVGKYLNSFDGTAPPGWDDWHGVNHTAYNPIAGYATDVMRDTAIEVIRSAPEDHPLFLAVGFKAPHSPWRPAERHRKAPVGRTLNRDDRARKRTLLAVDEAVVAIAAEMGKRWDTACVLFLTDNGIRLDEGEGGEKGIWYDEATRVPLRARCTGLQPGTDDRLAATIDLAPTILRAADSFLEREVDGRALQDAWDRDGILIEGWNKSKTETETARGPFVGIKGKDWLYVVPESQPARFYRNRRETVDVIDTLSAGRRAAYAAWLDALRSCAGDACRDAESRPQG